ncbi:MAG: beta strand repeat-containing protein [Aeromonas popoffii]|uniref:beta strand repeat-containing protein n=1 Tax=Aeromonas popoffii TaxID=70856 RepID=UPI003F38C871
MTFKTGNYRSTSGDSGETIPLTQVLPDGYEYRRSVTGQLQLWRVDVTPEVLLTEQDVGILDVNGSIRAAVNTLYLEQAHALKSSGEEIAFKNLETGVNYMPGWAGATPGGVNISPLGGIVEGPLNTNFEPAGTLLTTGAVNAEFTSVITANSTFYATYYVAAEAYTGALSLIVRDSRNEIVFKFDLPSAAYVAGSPISLPDIFYRARIGNTRTIGIYKDSGTPLLVRPGSLDNTKPYRKYSIRPFNDRRVVVVGEDGKVPLTDLPDLSTSIVLAVNTEAERLALPSANKLYIVTQSTAGPGSPAGYQWFLNPNLDPSVLGNWVQGANVGSTVLTFNGRTGTVTPQNGDYTPAQVGAVALPGADSVRRVLIGNTPTQENLVNDLNSTSATSVLSAAQGKILNDSKQATVTGAATSILNSDLTAFRVVITDAAGKVANSTVTSTELGRISGLTSNAQDQLNAKQATITGAATTIISSDLTVSRAVVSDATGKIAISTVTSAELGYLSGATGSVQTQLNSKQATVTGAATTILSSDLVASRVLISDATGKVAISGITDLELSYLSGLTSAIQTQLNAKQATITGAASTIVSSNLTASRALASDAAGKVVVTAVTDTELGRLTGITGNVQTQLNAKQATITGAATTVVSSDLTVSRAVVSDATGKIGVSATTDVELGRLTGVTGNVQTQLNAKQATVTGAATTVVTSDLTVSRAVVSDATGKIAVSAVTDTELGRLAGIKSNVQAQLDMSNCYALALWQANGVGSTTVSSYGGAFNTNGTAASNSMAATSYGRIRKVSYSVAVAGSLAGVTGPVAYDTDTGFNFCATWGLDSGLTSHTRAFIGFKSTALGNSDIATQTNLFGIGFNPSESNYSTVQNGSAGTAIKTDLGANFPAGSAGTNMFRLEMLCDPGSTTITWKLTRVAGGTSQVAQGTFNVSDLPAAGTFLTPQVTFMTTTASTTKVAVAKLSVQTNV